MVFVNGKKIAIVLNETIDKNLIKNKANVG